MKLLLAFFSLALAAVAQAASATGDRLLSIWEDVEEKKSYSKFLGDLEKRGYKITHATPKQEDLSLDRLGERAYDHVVIFPTKSKGLGPNLTAIKILRFLKAGGNVLVALSSTTSVPTALNAVLLELDMHLPAERTGLVVDHFHYDAGSAADAHDVLVLPGPGDYRPDTKSYFSSGDPKDVIAFPRGLGHVLGNGPLLTPILRAPRTAYIYNQKDQGEAVDEVFAAGQQLSLVSAFQARNSARLTLVGSAEMLQDKWFGAKVKLPGSKETVKVWNDELARRISAWTFHEIGHVRVNHVKHHLAEDGPLSNISNPAMYRINNDVIYEISLSEWTWDRWVGFQVPEGDELQLEFSKLSALHRLPLEKSKRASSETEGVHRVAFRIPDHHGVYNFMVNYKRPFLSNVEEKLSVTVRHMAHDEYPYSYEIPAAWPYLTSIGVTCVGWLVFLLIWMFNRPAQQAGAAKKTQ